MLKISGSTESIKRPGKSKARINGDSRTNLNNKCKLNSSEINGNKVDNNKVKDNKVEKNDQKTSKSKNLSKFKKTKSGFLIFEARLAFIKLK